MSLVQSASVGLFLVFVSLLVLSSVTSNEARKSCTASFDVCEYTIR